MRCILLIFAMTFLITSNQVISQTIGALKSGQKFSCIVDVVGNIQNGELKTRTEPINSKQVNFLFDGKNLIGKYADGKDLAISGATFKEHGSEKFEGKIIKNTYFVKDGSNALFFLLPDGRLEVIEKHALNNNFSSFMQFHANCK